MLNAIRKKYPQYNDMSNEQLATALYKKHYSDMPKADFMQKVGLSSVPTPQIPQPSEAQKIMQKIGAFGTGGLHGASQDIGAMTGMSPHDAMHLIPMASSLMNIEHRLIPQQTQQQMASSLPGEAGQLAGTVAGGAPLVGGIEASLPAELSNVGRGAVTGALSGGALTPGGLEDRLQGAGLGAGVGLIPGAAGAARAGLKKGVAAVTGKMGDNMASNLISRMGMGGDQKALNSLNVGNVLKNYRDQKGIGSNLFKMFLDLGRKAGYADKVNMGRPGISIATTDKFIKPTTGLANNLESLLHPTPESGIKDISAPTKDAINSYRSNPSLSNTHKLQSELGKEASNFYGKLGADTNDKQTASLLTSARNNTLDSTEQSLAQNGDSPLLALFKGARTNWAKNVVPYTENSAIMRAANNKAFPANILTLLSKDDEAGKMDTIRSHISENPAQRENLLAQVLSQGGKTVKGQFKNTLKKTISNYEKSPQFIQELSPSGLEDNLSKIAFRQKLAKYGTLGAGSLGAGSLLTHLGLKGLPEL